MTASAARRLLDRALVELQPRQRSGYTELPRSVRHLNQQPTVFMQGAVAQIKLAAGRHLQVGESKPRQRLYPCESVTAGDGLELIERLLLERSPGERSFRAQIGGQRVARAACIESRFGVENSAVPGDRL